MSLLRNIIVMFRRAVYFIWMDGNPRFKGSHGSNDVFKTFLRINCVTRNSSLLPLLLLYQYFEVE